MDRFTALALGVGHAQAGAQVPLRQLLPPEQPREQRCACAGGAAQQQGGGGGGRHQERGRGALGPGPGHSRYTTPGTGYMRQHYLLVSHG